MYQILSYFTTIFIYDKVQVGDISLLNIININA